MGCARDLIYLTRRGRLGGEMGLSVAYLTRPRGVVFGRGDTSHVSPSQTSLLVLIISRQLCEEGVCRRCRKWVSLVGSLEPIELCKMSFLFVCL